MHRPRSTSSSGVISRKGIVFSVLSITLWRRRRRALEGKLKIYNLKDYPRARHDVKSVVFASLPRRIYYLHRKCVIIWQPLRRRFETSAFRETRGSKKKKTVVCVARGRARRGFRKRGRGADEYAVTAVTRRCPSVRSVVFVGGPARRGTRGK